MNVLCWGLWSLCKGWHKAASRSGEPVAWMPWGMCHSVDLLLRFRSWLIFLKRINPKSTHLSKGSLRMSMILQWGAVSLRVSKVLGCRWLKSGGISVQSVWSHSCGCPAGIENTALLPAVMVAQGPELPLWHEQSSRVSSWARKNTNRAETGSFPQGQRLSWGSGSVLWGFVCHVVLFWCSAQNKLLFKLWSTSGRGWILLCKHLTEQWVQKEGTLFPSVFCVLGIRSAARYD